MLPAFAQVHARVAESKKVARETAFDDDDDDDDNAVKKKKWRKKRRWQLYRPVAITRLPLPCPAARHKFMLGC
jgi:hypothetical protein